MSAAKRLYSCRSVIAGVVGGLLLLVMPAFVTAQQRAPGAELKRVVGRVEVLAKGQTQWIPAVVGARLAEGDDIRAYSGASAEIVLPDTSTVMVTESSRLILTKMEYDTQSQSRLMLMHLVVGKVRATVAQAAISLARIRQSNFAISTPTAVAAARGTILWVFTDGQKSMMAVEPEFGFTEGSSQGVWRQ
ncbi:MAG TPA: FecR family protein [Candidatus Nitrosotalea sp.]|nr:FecR family protein [Candidatus Nitrosotalea sp.]